MKTQLRVERRALVARTLPRIVAMFGAIALASCVPTTPPLAGLDPSNPAAPVAKVGYRSTITGYRSQRPVEPQSWIEQNQRVAPQPDGKR